jgi:hypothetical protein
MQIVLQNIVKELGGTLSFPSSSSSSSSSWSKRLSKHSLKDKFPQGHDAKSRSTTNQNQSLVLFPEEYPIPQSLWISLGFPFSQLGNPSHDFSIPPTSFNIMFLQEQDNEISTYKP